MLETQKEVVQEYEMMAQIYVLKPRLRLFFAVMRLKRARNHIEQQKSSLEFQHTYTL